MGKVCSECGETFDASAKVCPYDGTQLEDQERGSDQLVGEVVDDRFRLDAVLGEGGMGKVYEATQLSVDRRVAVKMIRTSGLQSEEITQRFMREARVISGFSHPNIVRLIDFGEDDHLGIPYLAMEFLDGLELTELVTDSRLHPNFALEVASQIGAALVEAHDAGIVHRDLKTDNVLLMPVSSGACQVKVIDFGIAFPEENNENLTQTGMICGTPHYLSPEQARGDEVEPQSDLYSLGVILFEMATGELPFQADSPFNIMVKHVQEPAPSLTKYLGEGEVPPAFVQLIDDMLQKEPADRPSSGREIRRRITEIRDQTDWDPIRLQGTEPLRDEVAPWLLSKNVNSSSQIAFEETVGTDQGANTSNPGTVDKPLGGADGANGANGADGTQQGHAPANPGSSRQLPTDQSQPGTGQMNPADQSQSGTGQLDLADGATADARAGQPATDAPHDEARNKPTLDVAQTEEEPDHLRTLAVAATALFLLVGGLAAAALLLTGDSEQASGAAPAPKTESTPTAGSPTPADPAAGNQTAPSADESGSSEKETSPSAEGTDEAKPTDDGETAGSEGTADEPPTAAETSPGSDDSTGSDDSKGSEDSTASAGGESGAKPADESPTEQTGGQPDPSGGSPTEPRDRDRGSARRGSDSPPDDPEPSPSDDSQRKPSSGSGDSAGSDDENVDKEYKETVDWLTNE